MKNINIKESNKIETGFIVPENYFENLEQKIFEKLELSSTKNKVVSLWKKPSTWVSGIAAAFVVSLGFYFYKSEKVIENSITAQEYLAYQNDVSLEDIADNLTDSDITNLEKDLNLNSNISETYYNEYLN